MRIDLGLPLGGAIDVDRNAKAEQGTHVSGDRDVFGADEARLSSDLLNVRALESRVASVSDVRTDRVELLRGQVAGGTYHVNADSVAEALTRDLFQVNMRI